MTECRSIQEGIAQLLEGEQEVFVVYDRNVQAVADAIGARARFGIDATEENKTLETVQGICRWLLEAGATREALVVAVGGGITTDMAGFAACIYKRGIRYANVPTTLLAQVDAAIGGKTGVNLDGYKNMLGVIRQPEWTLVSASVLETLPRRHFLSGAAEMLKTFLLADAPAYHEAVTLLAEYPASAPEALQASIAAAARIKEGIVAQDLYEQGERRKLNLGHTFAHAIEHEARLRRDDITHGEAVAIGILLAARLSDRMRLSSGLEAQLREDFARVGLPTVCPYPLLELENAMALDKKAATGGAVRFVLPLVPGEVIVREMPLAEALNYLNDTL